jgi:SSS family solute:Na+ symporter
MMGVTIISALLFAMIIFNVASLPVLFGAIILLIFLVIIASDYFIDYNAQEKTDGLTVWSLSKTKENFKGSKINDKEGKIVHVMWRERKDDEDVINLSTEDMKKMAAEVGDIVYLCDARKYLGGLKSVHTRVGEPHDDPGIVLISKEHKLSALFQEDKILYAEKEM